MGNLQYQKEVILSNNLLPVNLVDSIKAGRSEMLKWGDFSTYYSKTGFELAREYNMNLESVGHMIHEYWKLAQWAAEQSLRDGQPVCVDYTLEKAEAHQAMRVEYKDLSREDQIKDLYLAYEFDKEWFMQQPGAQEIVDRFPEVIHWVDWS